MSADEELARLRIDLARLRAKHQKFATETNRIITEQLAEIQRLKKETAA